MQNTAARSTAEVETGVSRSRSGPSDLSGVVFDIQKFAIHDGPGIRTTVFLKGCPLRCQWCHNPEGWLEGPEFSMRVGRCADCGRCIETCPSGAISGNGERSITDTSKCILCGACVDACPTGAREIIGREMTVGQVVEEIQRDVIFFDESGGGVTFSGGEPLAQADFLRGLLIECKAREVHTALDTTCYAPWDVIETIAPHVDLFLIDLKQMDPAAHQRFTGVSNEPVLQNVRRLAAAGREIIIRIPVIPGVNDDHQSIVAIAKFVSSLENVSRIDILPYHEGARGKVERLGDRKQLLRVEPPKVVGNHAEQIDAIAATLLNRGFTVKIGG